MNYRELQTTLKSLRNAGHVSQSFKLNQKREVLQAEFDRVKAIAFSKIITTSAAPTVEPTPQQPQDFSKLIKAYDNYIPAYELAKHMGGITPKDFWKWAYAQVRAGEIELSTLQEGKNFTEDQRKYEAKGDANWFFVMFNY